MCELGLFLVSTWSKGDIYSTNRCASRQPLRYTLLTAVLQDECLDCSYMREPTSLKQKAWRIIIQFVGASSVEDMHLAHPEDLGLEQSQYNGDQ